jgi:alkanesulfonate monooxygenase SsuD/methylene tetrahydromethanopterin reductase-like flavin-dependent oxidoreductase (luciferase family)
MTAAGLDYVSGGRFTLGLGTSGPQVIEGWHGVPYDAPVGRTRELIDICRRVWRRERLDYHGKHYTLPLEGGTGLGKPLKLINHPVRDRIPIVIAAAPMAIGDDVTDLREHARPNLALYIGGMGARGRNFYYDLACRFGYEDEAKRIQDAYLDGRKDEAAGLVPAELVEKTQLVGPHGYIAERLAAFREAGVTTLNVTPLAATHEARVADIEQIRALVG